MSPAKLPTSPAPTSAEESAAPAPQPFYRGPTLNRAESVGWLMKHAVAGMHRELQDRMARFDVTSAQWPILMLVSQLGEPSAIEVARQLSMDAGAMTRMLDRMTEKGLIERKRCPNDRRAIRLALTDGGRQAVGPIAGVLADTLNDMLRGFSRDEFDSLLALLKRLDENCQSFPPYPAGTTDAHDSSTGERRPDAHDPAASGEPASRPPRPAAR